MPLNPGTWVGFSSTVTDAALTSHIDQLEEWLNGGIVAADLKTSSWVKARHIDPADFYGSPAPRWEGVSRIVHHRKVGPRLEDVALFVDDVAAGRWVTVPGLAARLRVHPQVNRSVSIETTCSFYAYEVGGSAASATGNDETATALCAEFALFSNGTQISGTLRKQYRGTAANKFYARKQHSIQRLIHGVSDGINDVSVKVKVYTASLNGDPQVRDHKFVRVQARNFISKVLYL